MSTSSPLPRDLRVEAQGGRLFARLWRTAGAAGRPPIVLFHDSLGCVELWRDFPERLARETGLPVLAYDRLGFGRSDPHPGPIEPDFIRREASASVPALLQAADADAFLALGHSVGGAMAVAAAARWPERCRAVATVAAQAFVEDRTLAGIRAARDGFAGEGQMERLARYHGDKAPFVLGAWTGTWLDPAFADWTLDADLRALTCPLLAVHGDRDEYGSTIHAERLARSAAGPALASIIADCGHVPHRERPEALLAHLAPFLRETSTGGGPAGARA